MVTCEHIAQASFAFSMSAESAGEYSDNLFYVQPEPPKRIYYVYILQSQTTGQFYVDSCSDLLEGFRGHQSNCEKATRGRGPWWIPYYEIYDSHKIADERVNEIKSQKSSKYIRRIIFGAYPAIELY